MADTLELSPDELLTTTRAVRRRRDLDRFVDVEEIKRVARVSLSTFPELLPSTGSFAR
jgi:hypothetical protein